MHSLNNQHIFADDICIVVVTYHPESSFEETYKCISSQASVVLIDNGSNSEMLKNLEENFASEKRIFIFNEVNLGLAKALNAGILQAQKLNASGIIFFDQDTIPDHDFVNQMCRLFNSTQGKKVAVLTSSFDKGDNKKRKQRGVDGEEWISVKSTSTSGSLIPMKIFDHIGLFRDDYFIDWIDTEFCLRAISKGYTVLRTKKTFMRHFVGQPSAHKILNKTIYVNNHSSLRRYYIYRNQIVTLKNYHAFVYKNSYYWIYKVFSRAFKNLITIWMFESDKLQKTKGIMLGFYDGFRSNMPDRLSIK